MDICRYFLCFALFGFIGWAYESVYYSIMQRRLVSSGFLNGCICPIYGIGGLVLSLMLGKIENPLHLFFSGMIITCTLEYIVSALMERVFHERWWDYSNWPLNINGRVCIIGGVAFGTMSVLGVKYIIPATFNAVIGLTDHMVHISAVIVAILILFDIIVTVRNSDNFNDKLWYVREQSKIFEEGGVGYRIMHTLNPFSDDEYEASIIEKIKRRLHK
ncbi:MAG: putative ABC transporter permease [Clostridia bacterium]|nr:putative ABC transporter permease [Clostridia bacterium]